MAQHATTKLPFGCHTVILGLGHLVMIKEQQHWLWCNFVREPSAGECKWRRAAAKLVHPMHTLGCHLTERPHPYITTHLEE